MQIKGHDSQNSLERKMEKTVGGNMRKSENR